MNTYEKIGWYPGHIKQARQKLKKRLKDIDILIIVLDARAPFTTNCDFLKTDKKNLHIITLINKFDLVLYNKAKFKKKYGEDVWFVSALKEASFKKVLNYINKFELKKSSDLKNFGFKEKNKNIMVAGMPNVGKSCIIKKLIPGKKLKVENRPGVTRKEQWIKAKGINLLDTPGVFYPEFENAEDIYKLALLNIVKPESIGVEKLFEFFFNFLTFSEKRLVCDYYKLEFCPEVHKFCINFGNKNGIKGVSNIARRVFSDYNKGKFKNVILDRF
ncbi:MAG: GTPase [Candidatus Muiribacteriota bacterium]